MKSFGCMLAVRTPEATQHTCHNAYWISAFPLRG